MNIAARLEPLAEPGGIAISGRVHAELRGRLPFAWADGAERLLKNSPEPVRPFLSTQPGAAAAASAAAPSRVAVLPFAGRPALARGFAWLVADALARTPTLAVSSRHGAEALAAGPRHPEEQAARLGIGAIVEGEVAATRSGLFAEVSVLGPRARTAPGLRREGEVAAILRAAAIPVPG